MVKNIFGSAVRLIQDGKESSPIRSDAYFPDWRPAFSRYIITSVKIMPC